MTMDVNQLRKLLTRIAQIAERSGGKRQAEGLRALADVICEEGTTSAGDAINRIRARLAAPPASKKRPPKLQLPSPSIDDYVQQLQAVQGVSDLDDLVQGFRARSFKKAKLDEIAHQFAKGPKSYKNKEEAIRDIERRVSQRKRAANEIEYLERKKVTPW
jgi:hypothetical protein